MNKITSFLKLIRYKNLLVYAICLLLIRINVIDIFYAKYGIVSSIPMSVYILFVIAFILAMAGGYIMNDYNDQQIDDINRLDKNIYVGRTIQPQSAKILAYSMSIASVIFAFVFDRMAHFFASTTIFFLIFAFIIDKSYNKLKNIFIGKNIFIAIIPVLLVFIPILLEYIKINANDGMLNTFGNDIALTRNIVLWFAILLFLISFIREIVKDMQDAKGDKQFGVKTIITKYDEKKTKHIIYILTFTLIALVLTFQIIYLRVNPLALLVGVTILVHIPLIYFLVELKKASIVQDYGFLSDLLSMLFISILFVTFFARTIIICGSLI
ncbi:MAG: UbiA family prenyltransferase [Bacteroidales bacterium]|nr:UbiA family prenyltransferase [Bacteroidales bacterium]